MPQTLTVLPVTLEGRWVRLEPLALRHAPDLLAVGQDEEIWTYLFRGPFTSLADTEDHVRDALEKAATGTELPFAIMAKERGRAVGSTRYLNIAPRDRGLEIGWTWLGRDHWRTPINTECKYLLLRHAFEALGCIRVQLKTNARNLRSQAAIERLGAVREAVFRKHIWQPRAGYYRDTVFYSILDTEWPEVKARLQQKLGG